MEPDLNTAAALAERVQRLQASPTLAVTARAAELQAQGRDIIGLGAGEPDFDTPEHIKEAAIRAIRAGQTKYTAVGGTPALKRAVMEKFRRENGLAYQANQILVSCGGKQSFFNLCQALLNHGDEAVIPAPYWVSYPEIVAITGATPVMPYAGPEQHFKLSAAQLERALTRRTRLLVINSPSNPTGMLYSRAELAAFGEVLRRHPQVFIATDDMYEHLLWQGGPFCNILAVCPDLYDRTLVLNGVSKAYAMTGWRIGYAGGPAWLIAAMTNVQSQSTSNPASISQAAAEAALTGDQRCVGEMCRAYQERHAFVYQRLSGMHGVRVLPVDGTFYSFPDLSAVIVRLKLADDNALAERLLNDAGIALVAGSAFGAPGHLRLSCATSMANLEAAMSRLEDFLRQAFA
ncbi:MAG: pyridoxal phosphate-dependent aminotransferase [Gammaproteobacteria bacterium]|nr:pyridoxal phosphate-dependent aminotransferase [Gammaproteobacteria bacterium]MBU6508695.1 pyridoxal phosphate-dependent aminotransferase [Gammaproteobacteria bacterium]MDE1982950.1 pyridoxal phosphate-dependent aminotransferase [Gammaproteobacteria bacterium]MDE2108321.1 pyridoxal phosphate-dependent aminotransferase [Gammaproteobacteria bacterium]MDE2459684.1 pyridoxal phosphate-dependent aminotransferase [Gammaproteobacteria bacterium]